MKLKDLLKVFDDEIIDVMKLYLKTEIHDIDLFPYELVFNANENDREVLVRYLDYFVVCVDDNFNITIKGHKIA